MKEYTINKDTLAIIPYLSHYSIVYELNNILVINKRPNNIIKYNCKLHGSTYEGRLYGTLSLIGCYYKAPITIDNNMVLFPTSSPRLSTCSWINLSNIKSINYSHKNNKSIINFNNDKYLYFNISKNILSNQYYKSVILEAKLNKNMV